jgi:hypothetical protein
LFDTNTETILLCYTLEDVWNGEPPGGAFIRREDFSQYPTAHGLLLVFSSFSLLSKADMKLVADVSMDHCHLPRTRRGVPCVDSVFLLVLAACGGAGV